MMYPSGACSAQLQRSTSVLEAASQPDGLVMSPPHTRNAKFSTEKKKKKKIQEKRPELNRHDRFHPGIPMAKEIETGAR